MSGAEPQGVRPGDVWGTPKWMLVVLGRSPTVKAEWRCLILQDDATPDTVGRVEELWEKDLPKISDLMLKGWEE